MEVRRRSRELAVVVHADVAGYSGLMEIDEDVAHARVTDYFDVVEIVLRDYGGSILEKRGDAILVDFKSASPAVAAALRAQEIVAARNKELTDSILPLLRIDIHLGEVIKDRGTVWGAGANMAQRVEQLATPGGVAVSSAVFDAITKSLPFDYEELGASKVKNTEVKAYRVRLREGIQPLGPERFIVRETGRPPEVLFLGTVLIVLIAILGVATFALFERHTTAVENDAAMKGDSARQSSVAVLRFDDLSATTGQTYFVQGLADTIVSRLSNLSGLKVASADSSFQINAEALDYEAAAAKLGVETLLVGSVQLADSQMRVTARLLDATSGESLWSKKFDTAANKIFGVQDEISEAVARYFEESLPSPPTKLSSHPSFEAYNYYLRGRYHWRNRSASDIRVAIGFFRKAIGADSGFALAYSGLADALIFLNTYGSETPSEIVANIDAAEDSVLTAISLDKHLAEAHASLGLLRDYDAEDGAEESFKRALALKPNYVTTYMWFGDYLRLRGRLSEALTVYQKGLELDPLSYIAHFNVGETRRLMGDYGRAARHLREAVSLKPSYTESYRSLAQSDWAEGRLEGAYAWYRRGLAVDAGAADLLLDIAMLCAEGGLYTESQRYLDAVPSSVPEARRRVHIQGLIELAQGRYQEALSVAQTVLLARPDSHDAMLVAGAAQLLLGKPEAAIEHYEAAATRLQTVHEVSLKDPGETRWLVVHSLMFAFAYKTGGEPFRGHQLVVGLESMMRSLTESEFHFPLLDYFRAGVAGFHGEHESAVRRLERAFLNGWRGRWELHHNPVFRGTADAPGRRELENRISKELLLFRRAVE